MQNPDSFAYVGKEELHKYVQCLILWHGEVCTDDDDNGQSMIV